MWIAEARKLETKKWKNRELTWPEFVERVQESFIRTGETMAEFARMSKDDRSALKELPGGFVAAKLRNGRRLKENVEERTLITLDADYANAGDGTDGWRRDYDEYTMLYPERTVLCYPTHSGTPEKPRLRWVLPVTRPMTPNEYPAVARKIADEIGIETMDQTTYDLNRLFYYPGLSKDAPGGVLYHEGEPVDVDKVLESYGPGDAWSDPSFWPTGSRELTTPRGADGKKAEDPTTKEGPVGVFCRTYDVYDVLDEFLADRYERIDDDRYRYISGEGKPGARVLEHGLFLYSFHSTDPASYRGVNAFDLVRIHKFGELDADLPEDASPTQMPSYKAMVAWMQTLPEVRATQQKEDVERFEETRAKLDIGEVVGCLDAVDDGVEDGAAEVDENWKDKLTFDGKHNLEPTLNNAIRLLANLPDFKGKLGYNPMNDTFTVKGDLPWWGLRKNHELAKMFPAMHDADDGDLKDRLDASTKLWGENDWSEYYAYMERLGYTISGQKSGVLDNALRALATRNAYHPIRSYLKALEWDGTERLDTLFIRWLGADDNELNRVITRRWMMAAVDRVMRPGCQFDEILITVGPQGIGKSKLLRTLARGFFTSSIKALDVGKTTSEMLQGIWIAEIGELDAMKKGEQTGIKNFITTVSDRYRSAYARNAVDHPRQCVLAGTSNEGSFLKDETGERRYWVMPVKGTGDRGELNGFKEEVDQLWAEAMVRWKERMMEMRRPGQNWEDVELYLYLREDRLEEEMDKRRQRYKMPDEERIDIKDYLDLPRPDNWYDLPIDNRRDYIRSNGDDVGYPNRSLIIDRVTIKEIACELFGADRGTKSYRISDVLDSMPGWKKLDGLRVAKGYGKSGRPTWVRIGSREDPDCKEEDDEHESD